MKYKISMKNTVLCPVERRRRLAQLAAVFDTKKASTPKVGSQDGVPAKVTQAKQKARGKRV